jgi:antitoxin component YwqK of YwqJK toxin-antitoxin module
VTTTSAPSSQATQPGDAATGRPPAGNAAADPVEPPPTFVKHEVRTTQYPDGKPRMRFAVDYYSDDTTVNNGPFEQWYPSGSKFIEGQYAKGQRTGEWKVLHENGKLNKIEKYVDGKLDGRWTVYREDGAPDRQVSFHAGQRDGHWNYFDTTGQQKTAEEEYSDGKPDGVWLLFYPNGKKQRELHYRNGRPDGTLTEWYENGQKALVKSYKDGQPNGKEMGWRSTGQKVRDKEWLNGHEIQSTDAAVPSPPPSEAPTTGG